MIAGRDWQWTGRTFGLRTRLLVGYLPGYLAATWDGIGMRESSLVPCVKSNAVAASVLSPLMSIIYDCLDTAM